MRMDFEPFLPFKYFPLWNHYRCLNSSYWGIIVIEGIYVLFEKQIFYLTYTSVS